MPQINLTERELHWLKQMSINSMGTMQMLPADVAESLQRYGLAEQGYGMPGISKLGSEYLRKLRKRH